MSDVEWWRGAVIYQIYPRSFQDDSGDGVGDLRGIIRRLDHVASLGVDAIWLSPFFTSPMADMGYDVADYRDVDPIFGTLADFRALLAKAHELGLRVIIDLVLSHSSDRHPWFVESRGSRDNPRADWYVWADPRPDGSPPNNWLAVFGGIAWTWEPRRRQYYMHNFLKEQPDFDFHNPAVQEAHLDTMRFWLDLGVDGFRLDTVNYYFHDARLRNNRALKRGETRPPVNPYDMQDHSRSKTQPETLAFLERMRAVTDEYGAAMVGEIGDPEWRALKVMADYTRGSRRLHMAYSFDMLGDAFSAAFYRDRIGGFFERAPDGWPCWSFSNHDVTRHLTRWRSHGVSETSLARLAIALLASFQGTVGIYQGEELGQTETELDFDELTDPKGIAFWPDERGRDGCRTPMVWSAEAPHGGFSDAKPWLPVKAPQAARAVDRQENDPESVLAHYRRVLAFRRDTDALRHGATRFADLPEPLLGFWRGDGDDAVLCLFNLGRDAREVTLDDTARAVGPGAARPEAGRLRLDGNAYLWLKGASAVAAVRGQA